MSDSAVIQRWSVRPARQVGGNIAVPGDKSVSHRALMFGGIAEGQTRISGFLAGEDCLATLRAMRALGVPIRQPSPTEVIVDGVGLDGLRGAGEPLDMGNAGTAMRLFMGMLAGRRFDTTLVGDSSLMRRPMERVAAPLRSMGALIETREGRPPVVIRASRGLDAIDFRMPVASAQVKSAVLLAALQARGRTRVVEPAVTRDHTERMLGAFGVQLQRAEREVMLEGGQRLRGTEVAVPGDFSSAAFFIVAGLLGSGSGLRIRNVGLNPTRTGLLEILREMGADIRIDAPRELGGEPVADLTVMPSELRGVVVDERWVSLAIDEFPVFFIAAACARGESLLRGAEELRVKESDRLAVMSAGLTALGVAHELLPDGMRLAGVTDLSPVFAAGRIDSHGDHRVAMSFAVASLRAAGPIEIDDVANVNTSFPGFAALADRAGLLLDEVR